MTGTEQRGGGSPLETTEVPSASLAARKKERTRREITTAAADLFRRRGWEATTVEDIAAAAEIGTRTFYRYFATKDDVIVDLVATGFELLLENLDHQPETVPLRQALRAAMRETTAAMPVPAAADLFLARTEYSLRARTQVRLMQLQDRWLPVVARRLGEPVDSLRTQVTGSAVTAAVLSAMAVRSADVDRRPFADLVDDALVIVLDGLDVRPAARRRVRRV